MPETRGHRVDLKPLTQSIWRHKGQRRQARRGAREGECEFEAYRGEPGPGHRHVELRGRGKILTPNSRRRVVVALKEEFGVSKRRGPQSPLSQAKEAPDGHWCRGGCDAPHCPHRAIWAMDFQFDKTSDLRPLKMLNIVDELTRECLSIDVARSITADDVVRRPDQLMFVRAHRSTSRWTTVPSSSRTRLPTGATSRTLVLTSLIRAHLGRTAGSNRSTPADVTSS